MDGSVPDVRETGPEIPACWLKPCLLLFFTLSGATALVYEVVLCRLMVRVLGSTMPAVSAVFAIYMVGMAAGAYAFGRLADRKRDWLRLYAAIELGLALYALFLPGIFAQDTVDAVFGQIGSAGLLAGQPARVFFSALILALPTGLMGASLPVLSRFFAQGSSLAGGGFAILYGANTLGGFIGAVAAGFWLVPACGLSGAVFAAAAINLLLAGAAFMLGRQPHKALAADGSTALRDNAPAGGADAAGWLVIVCPLAVFVSGALSLVFEVAMVRFVLLVFGSTTYAAAAVLAAVLMGIGAGSLLSSSVVPGRMKPYLALYLAFLAFALSTVGFLLSVNEMPFFLLALAELLSPQPAPPGFTQAMVARALVTTLIAAPPAAALGAIFPLATASVAVRPQTAGTIVGRLYAINTIGAVCGCLMGGFFLVPGLSAAFGSGIQATLIIAAAASLLAAALILIAWTWASPGRHLAMRAAPLLCAFAVFAGSLPAMRWDATALSSGISFAGAPQARADLAGLRRLLSTDSQLDLLYYREGGNTTVSVTGLTAANLVCLRNDGKVEASLPQDPLKPAPGSDLPTQTLLGILPLIAHPGRPARALLVGLGSGATAGAILSCPAVEHLTVVELEEAVVLAQGLFARANGDPLKELRRGSGRLDVVVADGRMYLGQSKERFDVIVSQPADPWVNGASNLFTREFWLQARRALADDGLFCQWLQLYAITPEYLGVLCRTFSAVFPSTYIFHPPGSAEIILIGSSRDLSFDRLRQAGALADGGLASAAQRAGFASLVECAASLLAAPAAVRDICRRIADTTGDARLNTDDNLLTEYQLPRTLFDRPYPDSRNFQALAPAIDGLADFWMAAGPAAASDRAAWLSSLALALGREAEADDLSHKRRQAACALARSALSLSRSPLVSCRSALVALAAGQTGLDARALFLQAASLDAATAADRAARACALYHLGQGPQAVAEARGILAGRPLEPACAVVAGAILLRSGLASEAAARLSSLDATGSDYLFVLGAARLVCGSYAQAEADLRGCLARWPAHFRARLLLAACLCAQGRETSGLDELYWASRARPESALAYEMIICRYMLAGDRAAARENIGAFLKRFGGPPPAALLQAGQEAQALERVWSGLWRQALPDVFLPTWI